MSLANHGLDVIKNIFRKKEHIQEEEASEKKEQLEDFDTKEDVTQLEGKVKVDQLKKEINLDGKIIRDEDLIDKDHGEKMCSADAQRKAKEYFAVIIPGGDGSALNTRESYDKTVQWTHANYISYDKINNQKHRSMPVEEYTNYMVNYFQSMEGNFFDILMDSKTSPKLGHRSIWFRWADSEIYVIDNAAKDKKMRSGAVPLSYYIKNFVTHGYWINGVWNYDTKYAYVVDPNNYKEDYRNIV